MLKNILAILAFALGVFVFTLALPKASFATSCSDYNESVTDNRVLQQILAACDQEIAAQQAILDQNQKQQVSLKQGIADITANINKSAAQINAQAAQIKKLGANIDQKVQYIGQLTDRMDTIKKSISQIIRQSFALNNASVIEILLSSDNLSNFLKSQDNYSTINGKLHDLTLELSGVKDTTESEKKDLETKKAEVEQLKYEEEQTKAQLEALKKEKQQILDVTKGQETAYKKVIADKERLKNQIRNRLFRTVGGVELTFGEALKLIQPYESTIGVNSALTLAILTQETGGQSSDGSTVIAKNLGKCYYNQPAANSAGTVMAPSQVPSFLAIMSDLGLNPNTTPVSCPIYRDGSYGGAIGPAQFMPKTWWDINAEVGYKARVGAVIGSSIPSPFENKDSFVGTALYLKDAQTICKNAFSKQWDMWACSASKYYGGLALKGSTLSKYMYKSSGYGYQVAQRATQFAKDIQTLSL